MKELKISQLELINGGTTAAEDFICGAAFGQYAGWMAYAMGLAGVTAGASALIGVGIAIVGVAVCVYAAHN